MAEPNGILGFCRDCLSYQTSDKPRCQACGSPRIIAHEELFDLTIAHIDCDAFYASVEKRDNPEIANKPLIIGGGKRGVVATACYLARIHGVRSAQPMYLAKKACPDAVVIPPNMAKYVKVSRQIRAMMEALTPAVQPLSIDEAFLDMSGTQKLHGHPPAYILARMAKQCQEKIGITVSIGLSHNKFLAKIASDLDKPRGFSIIGAAETLNFLAQQPLSKIWGVGKATREKLEKDGYHDVKALQEANPDDLMKRYGVLGQRLVQLANGIDKRTVKRDDGMKSVSKETTFEVDHMGGETLIPILRRLSEQVSQSLKDKAIAGHTIVLKLKTSDFKSRTRNRSLDDPTQLADRIFQEGRQMLEKELDGTKFRLIGIGVTNLCSPEQADPDDLIDEQANRRAAAEKAMDKVRDKFGSEAVKIGLIHRSKKH